MVEALSVPREEYERRLERVQAEMKQRGLDGLIVFSGFQEREGHVCYLTNHRNAFPNVLSHMGLGHSALLLPVEGLGTLVSPMGYEAGKTINLDGARTGFSLVADLVDEVKKRGLETKNIGAAGLDIVPVEYYENVRKGLGNPSLEKADELLENERLIKSDVEVELLRGAAQVADAALVAGMEAAEQGATGHTVEMAAREAALRAGADFVPRVRVVTGPAIQTLSWPMTTDKKIAGGDFVYLDVIGWAGGYGFDNSRIKMVGEPTERQRNFLDHIIEANRWMISRLEPGVRLNFVLTMSRERRITPFGHGIGLEICENPWITLGSENVTLKPNMVICIEPKVLDPQFGGMAVEDTVLITRTGVEVLNSCPHIFW
jgi:Xaa-Pro aminopeptidase